MFDKSKYKFCGTAKIKSITDAEDGIKIILLDNGRTFRAPEIILDKMLTEKEDKEAGDDWRALKLKCIAEDLLGLLRKVYHLAYGDLELLTQFMNTVVKNDIIIATKIKWGVWEHNLTLAEIENAINSDVKATKEARDEATQNYFRAKSEVKRG
jgi:hypothetical protein